MDNMKLKIMKIKDLLNKHDNWMKEEALREIKNKYHINKKLGQVIYDEWRKEYMELRRIT